MTATNGLRFWPDATVRHGSETPWSLAEEGARWEQAAARFASTQHLAFNHQDDGVRRETYVIAAMVAAADVDEERALPFCGAVRAGHVALQGGRWLDRFEQRGGKWRIAERRVVVDWIATAPGEALSTASGAVVAPAQASLDDMLAADAAEDCLVRQPLIASQLGAESPPIAVHVTSVRATVVGTAAAAHADFLAVHRANGAVELRGGHCALTLRREVVGWTVAGAEVRPVWRAIAPAPFLDAFVAATQPTAPAPPALGDTRSTDAAQLREREAIRDCLARYARGVDRLDRALVDSAFAGPPPAAVDTILAQAAQRPVQSHCISNLRIALHGDEALAEARYLTTIGYAHGGGHGLPGGTPGAHDINLVGGRYAIPLARQADGRWAMTDRGQAGEWHAVLDGSGRERFQRRTGNAIGRRNTAPV